MAETYKIQNDGEGDDKNDDDGDHNMDSNNDEEDDETAQMASVNQKWRRARPDEGLGLEHFTPAFAWYVCMLLRKESFFGDALTSILLSHCPSILEPVLGNKYSHR